jgi:hypothetical protein
LVCEGAAELGKALALDLAFQAFLDWGMEAAMEADKPDGRQSSQGGEKVTQWQDE